MKLSEHKELKKAILELPPKEKDKLLLRLIAKDKILTEHLHFKLLESELDLEDRKTTIRKQAFMVSEALNVLTTKDALAQVRKMISGVNHFYKVTKDPIGEVELKLFILNTIPVSFKRDFVGYRDFALVFANFYLKTTQVTLKKFYKLHEDLQFDLKEDFNQLLDKIYNSKLAIYVEDYKLPTRLD